MMRSSNFYYVWAPGEPVRSVDAWEWSIRFGIDERRVEQDAIWTPFGTLDVSTVFLGIDHNFSGDGAPVLFETMIFNGPLDLWQRRYVTEAEARAGHRDAIRIAHQARYRLDWWITHWWKGDH